MAFNANAALLLRTTAHQNRYNMKFTYYGHSCFAIDVKGAKLLFDPFVTLNELAKDKVDITTIEADYILVSHGHADHIADCVSIAARTKAKVICNWEIHLWLQKNGITNTHPMNIGGRWAFEFGTVRCVMAQHSSSLPDGSYGGNPMGFVITADTPFYYSGDTGLTLEMQLVPQGAPLSFSILPIGDNLTMGYEDAVRAAHMMGCSKVIGVHYNTFELIEIDTEKARKHFENNGLELLLPAIGESIEL